MVGSRGLIVRMVVSQTMSRRDTEEATYSDAEMGPNAEQIELGGIATEAHPFPVAM